MCFSNTYHNLYPDKYIAVSILVLMDVLLEYGTEIYRQARRTVSILVLMDVLLEFDSIDAVFTYINMFQSLF